MAWIYLTIAGIFEVVWAFSMKQSEGFTRPGATAVTIAAMIVSFALLALSMKSLPLGTAYTIWTGIGAFEENTASAKGKRREDRRPVQIRI